jgi:hypothetical protein
LTGDICSVHKITHHRPETLCSVHKKKTSHVRGICSIHKNTHHKLETYVQFIIGIGSVNIEIPG